MKHQKLNTTPEISKRMRSLSHKKSKVESILAKELWHRGYRYRLNYKKLPGTPDIAITKYRIAIFVDGEFWHGKDFNERKNKLKNNREYWIEKIEENIERDIRNNHLLQQLEWIPIHFWSKDIIKYPDLCADEVVQIIMNQKNDFDEEK